MAIYLLTTLPADRSRSIDQLPYQVVSAGSVADARAIAKSYRAAGISPVAWNNATITELMDVVSSEANAYSGWELLISVQDAPTTFTVQAMGVLGVTSAAIVSGGSGYTAGNVLTLAGGTAVRPATFRVTTESTGVVTGIELVDSGEYTVAPTGTQATTGSGTGCTLGTLVASSGSLAALLANAVSKLNARADVAGASLDMGASPPLLTVADATDALGDKTLVVELRPPVIYDDANRQVNNRLAIPDLVGTIVDQGSSGDVLSVAFPSQELTIVPATLLG